MVQTFNISTWIEQPWWNTGGTRNKKIYLNPVDNHQYYFKQSLKKEGRDYKYEFWSEIIASEIGLLCGFNVLPYHLAIRENEAGCLSKTMINPDMEELVEGGKFIQAFDNTFNPDDRKQRNRYDFDLLMDTFEAFKLEEYSKDIIEILVFDSLIGNSDRHQENWAFITEHSPISRSLAVIEHDLERLNNSNLPSWLKRIMNQIYLSKDSKTLKPEFKRIKFLKARNIRFAPIYDSGCSFGRELTDDRVLQLIENQEQIETYVKRGQSEIHWKNEKVSHFVLLKNLLADERFSEPVRTTIKRVIELFGTKVNELIYRIDVDLPLECHSVKIPEERKLLICKLVLSRLNCLKSLI